jgi:hypothetical protein
MVTFSGRSWEPHRAQDSLCGDEEIAFSGHFSEETMGKPMAFPHLNVFISGQQKMIKNAGSKYGYGSTAIKNINVNGRGMCVSKLF